MIEGVSSQPDRLELNTTMIVCSEWKIGNPAGNKGWRERLQGGTSRTANQNGTVKEYENELISFSRCHRFPASSDLFSATAKGKV
eukprot:4284874-Pleurochrysis_carterae.AAC.1